MIDATTLAERVIRWTHRRYQFLVCAKPIVKFDSVTKPDGLGGDDCADSPALGPFGRVFPVKVLV